MFTSLANLRSLSVAMELVRSSAGHIHPQMANSIKHSDTGREGTEEGLTVHKVGRSVSITAAQIPPVMPAILC